MEELFNLSHEKGFENSTWEGDREVSGDTWFLWMCLLQQWLRGEHKIRVYVENKVAGDFGFTIYIPNPDKGECIGRPWIKQPHYTLHFKTYEKALEAGLLEALKLIQ